MSGIKNLVDQLQTVTTLRIKMDKFVDVISQCSEPLDFLQQQRELPMDIISLAKFFCVSDGGLAQLIGSQVFTREESKLTNLFGEQGYLHRQRFAFPIYDVLGRTMAIASWGFNRRHKYVTSKTYGFKESCQFYGMEQIPNAVRHGFAIVVEGYFDRLRWIQAGFDNVLGVMSNELTPYKRLVLDRIPFVIFVPDNDKYGKINSHLSTDIAFKDSFKWFTHRNFVRLELPEKFKGKPVKDTDDFIKADVGNLKLLRFWAEQALKQRSGTILRMGA